MTRTPAYQTVYEALRKDIQDGVYQSGELLPPEPELERMYGVSRTTVRRAIALLVGDGMIHVRQGHGTEVMPQPMTSFTFHKFHNIVRVTERVTEDASFSSRGIHIDKVAAPAHVAQALEIAEDETVYRIQRIFCLDEKPIAMISNYLRRDFYPGLRRFSGTFADLYLFLQQQYGVTFESGIELVSATTADFVEAQILGVEVGAPLLFCKRTAQAAIGPMEYVETKLRPDKYELTIHMEGPPPKNYFYL